MKRIFALFLCILMCTCLVLTGCDKSEKKVSDELDELNGMSPEELYDAALEKIADASSYTSESVQDIVMAYGSEEMTMRQTVISMQNGYDLYTKMENDLTSAANMELTYVDGVLYIDSNGSKTKQAISQEDMDAYYQEIYGTDNSYSSTFLSIPDSWFEDATFKADGRNFTVTLNIPADHYTELVGNMGFSGAEFTSDVEYVIYFTANGDLDKVEIFFEFEIMGVSASCVTVSTITIGDVTITPPADADSYN